MPDPSTTKTMELVASDPGVQALSPMDLADVLLFSLARRRAGAFVVEPDSDGHLIRYELGETCERISLLPHAQGDALVARLSLVARLAIDRRDTSVARLRIAVRGRDSSGPLASSEVLVALRSAVHGLALELHFLGDRPDRLGADNASQPSEGTWGAPRTTKYRVLRELGRGGMGVVYEAEHVALKKRVAIKVLHPALARDPALSTQFLIEARAACRAHHRGIVDVTDFGHDPEGRAYFVMELVPWPTLETQLKHGPFELTRALRVAGNIAAALQAASEEGVSHRDLKPGNIFVSDDDAIKLADFGLAQIRGSQSTPGLSNRIIGTAAYMSPEQGRGETSDGRGDIYALGCVLFELLTGKPPYRGSRLHEVLALHARAPLPEVIGPLGPVPDSVQSVVHRALAKLPSERYQNAAEMERDLLAVERSATRDDWRRWLPR